MVLPSCRLSPSSFRSAAIPASVPRPPLTAEVVIGRVAFLTHRKEPAEAILDGEGRWRCPGLPVLERPLNALFAPDRQAPGDSPFGYDVLIRVASWLKGEVRQSGTFREW